MIIVNISSINCSTFIFYFHSMRVVNQNVQGILADTQYYKTPEMRQELVLLGKDVEELARDTAYEETRDSYHHHFWKADVESDNKCKFVCCFISLVGNGCLLCSPFTE